MAFEADPCQLRTATGELIARGFIREHTADRLLIDAQTLAGSWFEEGDQAEVEVFNTDRGALTYLGTVEFAAAKRVRLRDLRLKVVRQQRSALRVPTDLRVTITAQVVGGEEQPLDPPWTVTVIDLSAHGLRFQGEGGAEPGTRWRLTLHPPQGPLPLTVEVLRTEPVRTSIAHGCRFVEASEREHDVLFRWALDLQRLILARRTDRG